MTTRTFLRGFAGLLLLLAAGCSSTPEVEETLPPETLYRQGVAALLNEAYEPSVRRFEELDRKHPFSPWATRGQLNLIYAHYKNEAFDEAVSAAERFIRLHPRHEEVAYAFYMRALSEYKRIVDPMRDQSRTQQAAVAFREVLARFPQSDYAVEATRMLALCRDRLAAHEMVVGRFYLDRDQYIAAANRFRALVEDAEFNATPYAEEALFSLVMTSMKLGLTEEARNFASVLGHNFSDGPFYPHALTMIEEGGTPAKEEIQALREGVDEGSIFRRFFQGVAPGVPGLANQ